MKEGQGGEKCLGKKQMFLGVLKRTQSLHWYIELPCKLMLRKCSGVICYEIYGHQWSWSINRYLDGKAISSFYVLTHVRTSPSYQHKSSSGNSLSPSLVLATLPCLVFLAETHTRSVLTICFSGRIVARGVYDVKINWTVKINKY